MILYYKDTNKQGDCEVNHIWYAGGILRNGKFIIKEYLQSSAKSVFEYKYFMRQLDSALISNIERECNNEVALAFYSILQNISRKPKALFNLTTKLIVDYCM